MRNLKELIKFQDRRDIAKELILNDFTALPEKSVKELLDFVNYTEKYVRYLLYLLDLDDVATNNLLSNNKSLENVVNEYYGNKGFNDEKYSKWFINALVLVVIKGFEFDNVYFKKDGQKILKTTILKDGK